MLDHNTLVATTLRLERAILARLKHRAIDNHRSLNAEILFRLEESLTKENALEGATSKALVQ